MNRMRVVSRGARTRSGMSVTPMTAESSTTAVRPDSITPYFAETGSPSGPSTPAVRYSPWLAETSASSVPSPPSATGTSTTSASGKTSRTPRAIASAASVAVRVPLKAFGATTTLCTAHAPYPGSPDEATRTPTQTPDSPDYPGGGGLSVDRDRPVLVLRGVAAHRAEVDVLKLLGELADFAVADRPTVDLDHG